MGSSELSPRRPQYRLGDFVIKRHRFSDSETAGYQQHYEDSIGTAYLVTTKRRRKYALLSRLVDQWQSARSSTTPTERTLSIHLRLGDRITQKKLPTAAKIAAITERILRRHVEIDRIVLLYGNHIVGSDGRQDQSLEYISTLEGVLMQISDKLGRPMELEKRIDMDPDEDFAFLTNSKYCLLTIGGFSALAGILSGRRGGVVYLSSYRGPVRLLAQIFYSRLLGWPRRRQRLG
ncbi:hypothetical protein Q31b_07220 [Novipirellula aureliae]|uniref:Uncharacterized protein n=1 Tax=Novipirellula aureliae TaxID=2527966 RepID=A0A5C6E9N7_9BACT|nr:hypothetical protein [Novipirellula aureliae]TWU45548.1 hypothetical protein Q31b_07220 [Novipirellula aureliae]